MMHTTLPLPILETAIAFTVKVSIVIEHHLNIDPVFESRSAHITKHVLASTAKR